MRIIDADSLMDDIKRDSKKAIDEGDKVGSFWLGYAAGLVIKQPTIQQEKAQLSKESTTSDTISRQAAIDAINSWRGRFSEEYNEAIDDCENSIKELPTVQPEPQWIPVSERVPETEEFVLASLSGKYRNTTFEHACEIADYADGEWCIYAYPHMSAEKCAELIEAWMPLPEPYQKGATT